MNITSDVYKYSYNSIATITCNALASSVNNINGLTSTASAFIIAVKEKRLILITCAHVILKNDGNFILSEINYPITAAISNAKPSKSNICVNLFVIGMDIVTDVAILGTYLPSEINPTAGIYFGYKFSKKNNHLNWGDSTKTKIGTQIYSLTNAYAGGICESTGIVHDNDFVYATDSATYKNQTSQLLTSMNVDLGSSGAPVLVFKNNTALVIGIVAWLRNTNAGNFIGGASQKQMEICYKKILKLNPINKIALPYTPINFDSNTGKGFLGIESYIPLDQSASEMLNNLYPVYANSKYYNRIVGYVISIISNPTNPPTRVPNSRVNNAIDLSTGLISGIQINDIILEVNGVKVDLNSNPEYVTFDSYNDRFKPIYMKILRPSTAKIMNFKIISDIYPFEYEYVSITPDIELVTDVKIVTWCAKTDFNMIQLIPNGTLLYSPGNNTGWFPVVNNSGNTIISNVNFNSILDYESSTPTNFTFNNIHAYDNTQQILNYNSIASVSHTFAIYYIDTNGPHPLTLVLIINRGATYLDFYTAMIPSLSSLSSQ